MPNVSVHYYTDPACPWSWALEPELRKLLCEFGENLAITYVMGGIAREFGDAAGIAEQVLDAAATSAMPVDARLWFSAAPRSSYPACLAVKAAAEQGDPGPYLRRLREGFMCRARKLDTTEALVDEARAISGLDLERFRIDLGSHAILEAFGADLDRARGVASEHRSPGVERVELPSLEFAGPDGATHGVYGYAAYENLRAAAIAAGAEPRPQQAPLGVLEALRVFGTLAGAEAAAVCELPGPRAPAELWRLASEWQIRAERLGSGELWTLA